jgi:hypothetical protein
VNFLSSRSRCAYFDNLVNLGLNKDMSENTLTASCRCGQLQVTTTGEPVRVSVCHCLDCKKRSGSAFSAQARWPAEQIKTEGQSETWSQLADSGNRTTHHFCAECGSTVHYAIEGKFEGLVAIPLGAFDDPFFAAPAVSVWEERKHSWVAILGDDVEHLD